MYGNISKISSSPIYLAITVRICNLPYFIFYWPQTMFKLQYREHFKLLRYCIGFTFTAYMYCIVYKYCSRIAAYRRELPRWLAPYSDRRCRQRIPTKSNNSIILNKNTLHTESKCLFASNIAQFSFKPLLVSKKYVFIY